MVATHGTALPGSRAAAVDEMLAAFDFTPGRTVSGAAGGGQFTRGGGASLDSLDPTTGTGLAAVQTPTHAEYDAAVPSAQAVSGSTSPALREVQAGAP